MLWVAGEIPGPRPPALSDNPAIIIVIINYFIIIATICYKKA